MAYLRKKGDLMNVTSKAWKSELTRLYPADQKEQTPLLQECGWNMPLPGISHHTGIGGIVANAQGTQAERLVNAAADATAVNLIASTVFSDARQVANIARYGKEKAWIRRVQVICTLAGGELATAKERFIALPILDHIPTLPKMHALKISSTDQEAILSKLTAPVMRGVVRCKECGESVMPAFFFNILIKNKPLQVILYEFAPLEGWQVRRITQGAKFANIPDAFTIGFDQMLKEIDKLLHHPKK